MKKSLRIGTYNIAHAAVFNGNGEEIGVFLAEQKLDVVAVQEIDVGTRRVGGGDVLETVANSGAYPHSYFAKAMDYQGGGYGIGMLSRYPILEAETIPLYAGDVEPRTLCRVILDVDGEQLTVWNTHTSYESQEIRARQLEQITACISACEDFILMGDFNTADMQEFAALPYCTAVNTGRFGSFFETEQAIDHIFLSKGFMLCGANMPKVPYSDHYPIVAEVEFCKK